MFKRILIANRGEIACRILRSAHAMGVETVAVFSDADAGALHVKQATLAVHIGASVAADSYLNAEKIINAALDTGAEAIHPGYGFLSENPDFVDAVVAAGLVFIGPGSDAIRTMGLKDAAKQRVGDAGVPIVPGYHGKNQERDFLNREADAIGYPLLIKARAGGGGKGMRLVESSDEFNSALDSAVRESVAAFGDGAVLLEKFIQSPRHIEVQVFGDSTGQVVHLFERDCSLQRRHQKVIEEAPAPGMSDAVRKAMTQAAIIAARAINYTGAGTVEFIVDASAGAGASADVTGTLREDGFWFMEMNTRLQVEHPVTEAILGIDLVEWQLKVAAGEPLPLRQSELIVRGHSLEARLYAEDPAAGFLPVAGTLQKLAFSPDCRVDTGVQTGDTITPFYDPMIAKIIVHADSRAEAIEALRRALDSTQAIGTQTNTAFLASLVSSDAFVNASMTTTLIDERLATLLPDEEPSSMERFLACLALLQWPLHTTQPQSGFRLFGSATRWVLLQFADTVRTHRLVFGADNLVHFFEDVHGNRPDASPDLSITLFEILPERILYQHEGHKHEAQTFIWQSTPTGDACVWVKQEQFARTFVSPNPLTHTSNVASDANRVLAPMTGVIRKVHAKAGDEVGEGDTLIVLEAMKMETTLVAPRDGVVESVHCAPDDPVSDGDVLLDFVVGAAGDETKKC